MKNLMLVAIILILTSCDSMNSLEVENSVGYIDIGYIDVAFWGGMGNEGFDSIKVQWSTIEDKDESGNVIYPKKTNTLIDCHGIEQIIVAGDFSYPRFGRVDDCLDGEYFFKLKNARNDSLVYKVVFDYDSTFYRQNIDFVNGGIYQTHQTKLGSFECANLSVSGFYHPIDGKSNVEFKIINDSFIIPSLSSLKKDSLIEIVQSCTSIGYNTNLDKSYPLTKIFIYTL